MYTNQHIPLNLMFYIIITYVANYMENLHVSKLLNKVSILWNNFLNVNSESITIKLKG